MAEQDRTVRPEMNSGDWSGDLKRRFQPVPGWLYLLWWCAGFAFRLRVAPLAAYVIGFVALIEVLSVPLHHIFEYIPKVSVNQGTYLSAALFLCAATMVYHHHRITVRVQRHQVLLLTLRDAMLQGDDLARAGHGEENVRKFVVNTLEAVVAALSVGNSRKPDLDAVLLIREHSPDCLRIYEQSPEDSYKLPLTGLGLNSAAGRTLISLQPESVLYVPRTGMQHAIVVAPEERRLPRYRSLTLMDGAYEYVNGVESRRPLGCLACIQIPALSTASRRTQAHRHFVLCIGADKPNCLGELDWHAMQLVAAIIGRALNGR